MNQQPQPLITETVGTVVNLYAERGFGFLSFVTESGRRLRIYFHVANSDGTDFQVGDKVSFSVGIDSQRRPRAYAVKFMSAASSEVKP